MPFHVGIKGNFCCYEAVKWFGNSFIAIVFWPEKPWKLIANGWEKEKQAIKIKILIWSNLDIVHILSRAVLKQAEHTKLLDLVSPSKLKFEQIRRRSHVRKKMEREAKDRHSENSAWTVWRHRGFYSLFRSVIPHICWHFLLCLSHMGETLFFHFLGYSFLLSPSFCVFFVFFFSRRPLLHSLCIS